MKVTDFHYNLPESAIAQTAVEPRHSSRLLDTRDLTDHLFVGLPSRLRPGDLVVVNETRVRAARLQGRRAPSGGRVEVLLLERNADGQWSALALPARRLHEGDRLIFDGLEAIVCANLGEGMIQLTIDNPDEEAAIEEKGRVPLPPYFKGELEDAGRYQTIFATAIGSAAAPTAGLHFTTDVVNGLASAGVRLATVDLHVSLDTFRPMTVSDTDDHEMHSEWCNIPDETALAIAHARSEGGRVVAVGTTVVRTLESGADGLGGVTPGSRVTDIFLTSKSEFTVTDLLVTNFHLPGSTLLVLLAGFMGPAWRTAYEKALERGYRFLSFGDAMIAERAK